MTTTDSNGLIQYQTTDNVVPLQTTLNCKRGNLDRRKQKIASRAGIIPADNLAEFLLRAGQPGD